MNDQIDDDGIYDFSFSMMVMSTDNDKIIVDNLESSLLLLST